MKKVLITGSNGYIGQHIVNKLKNDFELYGINSQNRNLNEGIVKNYFVDIKDFNKVEKVINEVKPNIIIHLAAIVHKNNNDTSENNYMKINYQASKNIFEMADKYKVEKVIFSSTIEVYGENNLNIITNNTNCNPQSFYGKSKYLAEKELLEKKYNFKYYILRFAPVYGKDFTLNTDKRIFLKKNKIAYYFKKGNYSFSFCSINNITNFVLHLLNSNYESSIVILSDKENYSAKYLIETYKKYYKKIISIKLPYYISLALLTTISFILSKISKKDTYFSKRNFEKLFSSKRYETINENFNINELMFENFESTIFGEEYENINN